MINENVPLALIHVIANISHLLPFRIVRAADRNLSQTYTNCDLFLSNSFRFNYTRVQNNISLAMLDECPVRAARASLANSSLIEITMSGH